MFCASLALEIDGHAAAGAIYDPTRKELFTGERGVGAFLNGTRLRVSETGALLDALLVTGFPYDVHQKLQPLIAMFSAFLGQASSAPAGLSRTRSLLCRGGPLRWILGTEPQALGCPLAHSSSRKRAAGSQEWTVLDSTPLQHTLSLLTDASTRPCSSDRGAAGQSQKSKVKCKVCRWHHTCNSACQLDVLSSSERCHAAENMISAVLMFAAIITCARPAHAQQTLNFTLGYFNPLGWESRDPETMSSTSITHFLHLTSTNSGAHRWAESGS